LHDTLSIAKWLYSMRALRPGSHVEGLYADPAWDILLDLYIREKSGVQTSITSACIAARAPSTTALRYISRLCREQLLERQPDAVDRRRHWLVLNRDMAASLDAYMAAIKTAFSALAADMPTDADFMKVVQTVRTACGLMRTAEAALRRMEGRFGREWSDAAEGCDAA